MSKVDSFMQKHMTLLIFSFVVESLVIITSFHSLSNNIYYVFEPLYLHNCWNNDIELGLDQ